MSTMKSKRRPRQGADPGQRQEAEAIVDRLAGLLPEEALQDALKGLEPDEITRPRGLLSELAGRVLETALGAELSDHLGHSPGGVPAGANVRNGSTPKTVATDLGPVPVNTPRDRDGSFERRGRGAAAPRRRAEPGDVDLSEAVLGPPSLGDRASPRCEPGAHRVGGRHHMWNPHPFWQRRSSAEAVSRPGRRALAIRLCGFAAAVVLLHLPGWGLFWFYSHRYQHHP